MSSMPLVTRFAPNPAGYLHLGNARTALLNFLAARCSGGRFILRLEDTEELRGADGSINDVFEDLHWLGLDWDEGPDVGGPHAVYRQQGRRAIYERWLARLDATGFTYPCFCTPAELNLTRRHQLASAKPLRYAGTCRDLREEERAERLVRGQPAAIRFRVQPGQGLEFTDLVHGQRRFSSNDIGDFILRRADGSTAFFFSNAIDDALMEVSLVLRGEDHLANTPRQLLILQALGMPVPLYAHVALLLGARGAALSKRDGALSLRDLRRRGYLPQALRNHLVRLGHSCTSEAWLEDAAMRAAFDMHRLGRTAARFDEAQLRHWQREAVVRLRPIELRAWLMEQLPSHLSVSERDALCGAIRHHLEFPSDAKRWVDIVFGALPPPSAQAQAAIREAGQQFFVIARRVLQAGSGDLDQRLQQLGQLVGRSGPALYAPLSAAITGVIMGPELLLLLSLIPASEITARLAEAERMTCL